MPQSLAMEPVRELRVATPDGHTLAAIEAGPRDAPALLLLHGIAQSKQSWRPLLEGALAHDHRLVAVDLRGHGDSTAPDPLHRSLLGDDVAALLGALGLRRPTLLAWSYGGVVVGEYLRRYGEQALGGVILLAASIKTGRGALDLFGPAMLDNGRALLSDDAATYEAGARAFLRGCTAAPQPDALASSALAGMLRVPAAVRRALLSGAEDYTPDLARTTLPLATLHGELDAVVKPAMSDLAASLRPGVAQARLAGVGHSPWLEAPGPFEAALRSLLPR